jgi:glycosyltransferase involved in cell wall biosynthesis
MLEKQKIKTIIQAPITSESGYGKRSIDLVRAMISVGEYDITIIPTLWGNTPTTALKPGIDDDILCLIATQNHPLPFPDLFIQVALPIEFQPRGKFNIGITASIETDHCHPSWIAGCNRMNLVLTSSIHGRDVILKTQKENNIRLTTPIEVLFEGVNTNIFTKTYNKSVDNIFKDIKEDFCFLFVGHWLPGSFTQDRKNVSGLIYTFLTAFKNKINAPALLLKTFSGTFSILDKEEIEKKISSIKEQIKKEDPSIISLPNIYLIYGDLTDSQMSDLYNHPKVKVNISFTRGEGFGRPLIEAAISGKPMIIPKWSGYLDFLPDDMVTLVDGILEPVNESVCWENIITKDMKWFTIDYSKAILYMKDIYANYKQYLENSRKLTHHIKSKFTLDLMGSLFNNILSKYDIHILTSVILQPNKKLDVRKTVSYAICTHNEGENINKLCTDIQTHMNNDDELIICDDMSDDITTQHILNTLKELNKSNIKVLYHKFDGDFSKQKNWLQNQCTKDYIFNIDADELISDSLFNFINDNLTIYDDNNMNDVFWIPRINIVSDIDKEYIHQYGWKEEPCITYLGKQKLNWPDIQGRIYKNNKQICWSGTVHETLSHYTYYTILPFDNEDISLIHIKTFQKQILQNLMYSTLQK